VDYQPKTCLYIPCNEADVIQDTTPLTRSDGKKIAMAKKEEVLTSGEVLLYAAAVVWSQRRMQLHLNRASAETSERLNSKGLAVKSF
jgi:hypothetical protein